MTLTAPDGQDSRQHLARRGAVDTRTGVKRAVGGVPGEGLEGGLSVWTDQWANRCVLRLRGALTSATVHVLDRHVDQLGCRWCDEVVVELTLVDEIEPVGARLITGLGHYVAGRGGRFSVEGASADALAALQAAEEEMA